jgi:hypothetical protein
MVELQVGRRTTKLTSTCVALPDVLTNFHRNEFSQRPIGDTIGCHYRFRFIDSLLKLESV